eukprot:TRINITY_DN26081_c0_g1_i1.p1 TRINITY_DN26081_c0_g1~~TRINITY_DN26081_c0_g1_i1.p1  ORF type:complete len:108 (+),score=24.08 TRINITY_DN26081_c0_g1_i1:113-436(+)
MCIRDSGGGDAGRGSGTFSYVPLDRTASGNIKERSLQLPMPTQDSRLQGSIGNGTSSVPEMLPSSLLPIHLSLIHISEPTRLLSISYAVFCLKKKKTYTHYYSASHT